MYALWEDDIFRVPVSAQRLWYHLAAEADEDGIVKNAREIRTRLGADDDDVRNLLRAGLVVLTPEKHVWMQYPQGKRPEFVKKKNGITYARVKPFVAGYGFLKTAAPIEVPLIW